ncbi:hypothetical protein [Streptomyces sp. NPDC048269]|uniref:hypothetical protein n=1 Tax=Streptomyces sp. NPDC048269 TaxID=3155753 RepID=UPI003430123E
MTQRLDPGAGWYGEFLRRDPDGLRACLDGAAIPPWDVVESLLRDLTATRGEQIGARETVYAARLRAAAVTAWDRLPGGTEELRTQYAGAAAQRADARAALRSLTARLGGAGDPAEADALARELSWAQDDAARAAARHEDISARLAALRAGPGDSVRPAGPDTPRPLPAVLRQRPAGLAPPTAPADLPLAQAEVPVGRADLPLAQAEVPVGRADLPLAQAEVPVGRAGTPVVQAEVPVGRPEGRWLRGARRAGGARYAGSAAAEAPAFTPPPGHPDGDTAPGEGRAPRGARFGRPEPELPAPRGARFGRPAGAMPEDTPAAREPGHQPTPTPGAPRPGAGGGAPPAGPGKPGPEAWIHTATGHGPGETASGADGFAAPGYGESGPGVWGQMADGPELGEAVASGCDELGPGVWAHTAIGHEPGETVSGAGGFVGSRYGELGPGNWAQAVAPGYRESGSGGRDRIADGPEPGEAYPVGAWGVEGLPGPGEAAARSAPSARSTRAVVGELIALRAQGRGGEAHALLCEAAAWRADRLPGLADQLARAGLAADWATLLWEAASLPPERLAAAAAALGGAGREADSDALLRQGVARPTAEIAEAALALGAADRTREADALLDAFVRVRTAEEAAALARRDPQWFAPRLLQAAAALSGTRHRDLLHAFRVAGITAA